MEGNDGIGYMDGKILLFKYKKGQDNEEIPSDYKYNIGMEKAKFTCMAIIHIAGQKGINISPMELIVKKTQKH